MNTIKKVDKVFYDVEKATSPNGIDMSGNYLYCYCPSCHTEHSGYSWKWKGRNYLCEECGSAYHIPENVEIIGR